MIRCYGEWVRWFWSWLKFEVRNRGDFHGAHNAGFLALLQDAWSVRPSHCPGCGRWVMKLPEGVTCRDCSKDEE